MRRSAVVRGITASAVVAALLVTSVVVVPVEAAKPVKPTPTPTPTATRTPTNTPPPAPTATSTPTSAPITGSVPCSQGSGGTWTPGEVTLHFFDVEQGDSQLLIGPTGRTLLIDLGELNYAEDGPTTNAAMIEAKIRAICGTGSSPVHLDYVMASHHHLDHIGYARVPDDTSSYGNGIYQLLTPKSTGGFGFSVGQLIDRDGGAWRDSNGDGRCQVGTSSNPSTEIAWHNAGTTSQTARRWICWLYGPANQPDRALIHGKVLTLKNTDASWPNLDLGTGVTARILNANGKDTKLADGVTPVSGDHTTAATPPSENDYSIALLVQYGTWKYATAGDSDGEWNTSSFGYTYNNIEAKLGPLYGNVDTMRANHHGSGHSSSQAYLDTLKPETAFFSCGVNSYGHPDNRVLQALRTITNDRGVGAEIYLANNPCDTTQGDGTTTDYSGTLNKNGDVVFRTTGTGSGYSVTYDSGTRSYTAYGNGGPTPSATSTATATAVPPTATPTATATNTPLPATSTPTATATPLPPTSTPTATATAVPPTATPTPTASVGPASVKINEYLMAPQTTSSTEWVELFNTASSPVDIGGLYVDDVAGGGGAPKQIPAGTTIAAGGYYVLEFASGFLNNTGSESVRFLSISNGVETVYDSHSYSLGSTQYDRVFHRVGDGGAWCGTVSANATRGTANPTTCP